MKEQGYSNLVGEEDVPVEIEDEEDDS